MASTERELIFAGLLGLACCQPVPVPLYVENPTTETIEVRVAGSQGPWAAIDPGATGSVGSFNYDGWCNVPDRWVPEHFTGLEIRLRHGGRRDVTTEQFVAKARYDRGWTYRYTRSGADGPSSPQTAGER